jgi:hypothetical protein
MLADTVSAACVRLPIVQVSDYEFLSARFITSAKSFGNGSRRTPA